MKPTGEEILRASWPKRLQPSFNGVSCLLRDLKLDWSTGLPLNDRCPLPHLCSRTDLVQAKFIVPSRQHMMRSSEFLGFEFRYLRGLSGAMRPHYTPKLKKRTALVRALKEVFRRHRSQPIERVIALINPVLRGWVNYFAVGHSSECFSFIKDWVEKKVRRHLAHAQKRKGFDWERWNRRWLYDTLGLFNAYRVRRDGPKVAPAG